MFQEMMIGSSGGGIAGAYGTCTDVTGNAQTVTINTGLTNVKRFMLNCNGNSNGTTIVFVTYNESISQTNYKVSSLANNTVYDKAIGTASGYAYGPQIASINGGTITLKTGANNAAAIKSAWWMACS